MCSGVLVEIILPCCSNFTLQCLTGRRWCSVTVFYFSYGCSWSSPNATGLCLPSVLWYLSFSLSLQSTVVLFQTVSMTLCDSSFCLLRPLRQNGLPPPFPGETVPLFLYLLTCVVARLQRTPTLLFLLSATLSTNFIVFKFAVMGTGFRGSSWLFSRCWRWF